MSPWQVNAEPANPNEVAGLDAGWYPSGWAHVRTRFVATKGEEMRGKSQEMADGLLASAVAEVNGNPAVDRLRKLQQERETVAREVAAADQAVKDLQAKRAALLRADQADLDELAAALTGIGAHKIRKAALGKRLQALDGIIAAAQGAALQAVRAAVGPAVTAGRERLRADRDKALAALAAKVERQITEVGIIALALGTGPLADYGEAYKHVCAKVGIRPD